MVNSLYHSSHTKPLVNCLYIIVRKIMAVQFYLIEIGFGPYFSQPAKHIPFSTLQTTTLDLEYQHVNEFNLTKHYISSTLVPHIFLGFH